jgi:chemotaxis protein MotC
VRAFWRAIVGVGIGLAPMQHALGEEAAKQPYELVRALNALQDESARGNAEAHIRQRQLIPLLAQQFVSADASVWTDPKNVKAAVVYALSGGEPRVLKSLFALRQLPGVDERLLNAALAYSEGRNTDALELFGHIDARTLDWALGARVALVHSGLMTTKDAKGAVALLDDARLLAPGTIVEDAALRRQVFVVAGLGDFDAFEMLASQYMRRFPNSIYAATFHEQFASEVAGDRYGQDAERLRKLESTLEGIDVVNRRRCYLLIALEAVAKGRVELARLAARNAIRLTADNAPDHMRARVYEAATLVVTEDYESGVAALIGLDKTALDARDAELLEAAFAVAEEVRRPPSASDTNAPADSVSQAKGDSVPELKAVALAQKVLARVDAILTEGRQ